MNSKCSRWKELRDLERKAMETITFKYKSIFSNCEWRESPKMTDYVKSIEE